MKIKYPLIIPSIGHGSTDLLDLPYESLYYNLISCLIVYNLNYNLRKIILVLSSIIHIADDFYIKNNSKYFFSSVFHILWLKFPLISKIYLSFIHTPLHYIKIYKINNKWKEKLFLANIVNFFSILGLKNNIDMLIEKRMGKLWWIFPIIPHIYLTKKIDKLNNNKKKDYIFIKKNIIHVI
tara:strand:+ start:259 stop:801 length:543 start_codon:yes stop_codon:yes gene_type:complete